MILANFFNFRTFPEYFRLISFFKMFRVPSNLIPFSYLYLLLIRECFWNISKTFCFSAQILFKIGMSLERSESIHFWIHFSYKRVLSLFYVSEIFQIRSKYLFIFRRGEKYVPGIQIYQSYCKNNYKVYRPSGDDRI